MDEQTTKLIEDLAAKLGTTAEYLWTVLIKQAPVSATISLIQCILILVFGVVLYVAHKIFSKEPDRGQSVYYECEALGPIMGILFIAWLILCAAGFFACIPDIINGYSNPEFWALDYIMGRIKD